MINTKSIASKEENIKRMRAMNYTKVLTPKNKKSEVWSYFGFPGNGNNEVVTKNVLICRVCFVIIRNYRNTTNLRRHLIAHQIDLSQDVDELYASSLPFSKIKQGRPKIKLFCTNELSDFQNDDKTDREDTSKLSKNLDTTYLRDMVIMDLMPTCFFQNNNGFRIMLEKLTKYDLPTKDEIEKSISTLYASSSTDLINDLKCISVNKPFSLSYEIWENIENYEFITLYFHYLKTDDTKEILKEVLLKTIELTKNINFEEVFEGFNMKNCVAVISADGTDLTEKFFTKQGIPMLPCLECIVKKCLNKIFDLSLVNSIYNNIKDFLKDTKKELCIKDKIEIPKENRNFPWAKYNILKFFVENIEDPNNEILPKAKSILETLSPLKTTIESLAEERDLLNCFAKPLAIQLIDNHFKSKEDDTQTDTDIKEIICFEFSNKILSNKIFSVSAFLDPRFQNYLDDDCFATVKSQLVNKAKELNLLMSLNEFNKESFSEGTTDSSNISQKKVSPLDWWKSFGISYGSLKKVADVYNTIPCLCNKSAISPIERQIEIQNKKFNLKGNLINEIIFLNYNFH